MFSRVNILFTYYFPVTLTSDVKCRTSRQIKIRLDLILKLILNLNLTPPILNITLNITNHTLLNSHTCGVPMTSDVIVPGKYYVNDSLPFGARLESFKYTELDFCSKRAVAFLLPACLARGHNCLPA